ncbi:MAG: Flp pilus assembly protein CpaB [Kiritimatiellae bacterium]|nr:Flp pilus assembly protein CpaB [Kiritimatiellia bacterium]MDD5520401.1 Flp pilus assembly protein CpaB [Kiritimatiellia bacterium]
MKQKIIPIISIVVGLLAFWLTGSYLRSQRDALEKERQKMYAGAKRVDIVVASSDIPSQTAIRKEDLGLDNVLESTVPPDVVTTDDAQQILGKKVIFAVGRNRAILWSNIEGADRSADLSLAAIVSPRMRAISLPISGSAAVSSLILPNDRIDILGTFSFPSKKVPGQMETVTLTVLQDVTVLATGQTIAKQSNLRRRHMAGSASYNSITVEVTPREAELLVFAQQMKGSLMLSLRNPTDVSFEKDLPEVNFQQIQTSLPELNQYRQKVIRHSTTP